MTKEQIKNKFEGLFEEGKKEEAVAFVEESFGEISDQEKLDLVQELIQNEDYNEALGQSDQIFRTLKEAANL